MTSENSKPSAEKTTMNAGNSPAMDWNRRAGPVFKYGLIVGFALVLLGGLSLGLSLTNAFLEILVVCAGLSIILGAFGSTATVSLPGQSITLVGVAALAVALFIVLLSQMDDRYVRVKISGDVQGATMDFEGDRKYLGAFQGRTYDFLILGKNIERDIMALYISLPDGGIEKPFACIRAKEVRPYLASGKTIEWSYNRAEDVLTDPVSGRIIASLGDCYTQRRRSEEDRGADPEATPRSRPEADNEKPSFSWLELLFADAWAQSTPSFGASTAQLLELLESDTSYVRRGARDQLAALGIDAVPNLLQHLERHSNSYRARLGVIVALTEMMRENKSHRVEIARKIEDHQLALLIDAAGDEDRTIRIYASEFLYDLGDPRSIALALEAMRDTSPNGRYNLLLVTKGAIPYSSAAQRATLARELPDLKAANTPKTNQLIESVLASVSAAGN